MRIICSVAVWAEGSCLSSEVVVSVVVHGYLAFLGFWIFELGWFVDVGVSGRPLEVSFIYILLRDIKIFHCVFELLNLCYVLLGKFVGGVWVTIKEFLEVFDVLILDDKLIYIFFFYKSEDRVAGDGVCGRIFGFWLLELDFDFLFVLGLVFLDCTKFLLNGLYQFVCISILLDV